MLPATPLEFPGSLASGLSWSQCFLSVLLWAAAVGLLFSRMIFANREQDWLEFTTDLCSLVRPHCHIPQRPSFLSLSLSLCSGLETKEVNWSPLNSQPSEMASPCCSLNRACQVFGQCSELKAVYYLLL